MSDIIAYGVALQPTSAAMIPTIFDELSSGGVLQSTPASAYQIMTLPTFSGITTLAAQLSGSLLATWSSASGPNAPIVYDVYIQLGTASGLFVDANKVQSTFGLTSEIFHLKSGALLVYGSTYFVGVRARDPLGNLATDLSSLSAISSGVAPGRPLSPPDISTIVAAVWDELASAHTAAGSFGSFLEAKVSLRATQASVDTINTKLGSPVGSTFSADYQSIQSGVNTTNTKIGTPSGASVSADIAAVKTDADTLLSRLTAPRAANMDFLDVAISTRESDSNALSRHASETSDIAGVLTAVQSIQNNTNFVGVVPTILNVPNTGSSTYKFFASLFDDTGNPEDPDTNTLNYSIIDTSGAVIVATTPMTRTDVGVFEAAYAVSSGSADVDVIVVFTYAEAAVNFIHRRTARIQSASGDIDTLLSRLTPGRAANLDNLDVLVSSRVSDANDLVRYTNLLTEHATSQAAVAAVSGKIGVPVLGSVTADVTAVRIQTDKIGSPVHTTLAADLAAIEGKVGSPVSTVSADIAAVKADVASVKADSSGLRADYTTVRASKLDNVDVPVSSRQSEASAASRFATLNATTTTLENRLTAPRAANLDNLDATMTSRATQADVLGIRATTDLLPTSAYAPIAAIKAKTDTIPADISDVALKEDVEAQAVYVNRMSTVFDNLTGIQEVLAWSEKNGQVIAGTDCSIAVKDDAGVTIWADAAATPTANGVFKFTHVFGPTVDGNYYVEISITADGVPRLNKQPFVAVG